MAWITQVPVAEATGRLKRQFDAALQRAGRVWKIVHVMSVNPATLEASMRFYAQVVKGSSPLTRVQRELLATVVSAELGCRYWTRAHAHDLREEVAALIPDADAADSFVDAVARDWRSAPLSDADRALCEFAAKVTHRQRELSPADLDALRAHGLDDRAIHDGTQVIAYFNYITRIADALGVEPEDFVRAWGE